MAGLPWIEVDTDLPRNPKAVRLGLKLNDPRAWSYMVQLWFWCAETLPEGELAGDDAADVLERAIDWRGERGHFVAAATDVGVIERSESGLIVHGWKERATAHIAKRKRDAKRQRERRGRVSRRFHDKASPGRPRDVRVTSLGHPRESQGDIDTKPNPKPNQKLKAEKPPEREPPDSRHAPLVSRLCLAFEAEKGATYPFGGKYGGRNARAVSDLLRLGDEAVVEAVWRKALQHRGFPRVRMLWELVDTWPHFVGNDPNGAAGKSLIGMPGTAEEHAKGERPF